MNVARDGTCFGYCWTITWTSIGGDKKPLKFIDQSLDGLQIQTSVETLQDGGVLYGPLTGEFLQVAEQSPQVCKLFSFCKI